MNLYISNLSYNISDEDLRLLFADYGEITSAKVIMDRETGKSKGFGFVEMAEASAGNQAIEALNGNDCEGRTLRVNEAKPREERPRRQF